MDVDIPPHKHEYQSVAHEKMYQKLIVRMGTCLKDQQGLHPEIDN
ncbi:MAG: hypothetical protein QXL17_08320 [Candidatus Thermoplasmatota archaeon]